LNVRSGPGLNYAVTTQIKKGEKYAVLDEKNGWSKIKIGQAYGWVAGWLISKEKGQATKDSKKVFVTITATRLNVRLGPGLNNSVLGQLNKGEQVEILEIQNGWYRLLFHQKTGWIAGQYANKVTTSNQPTVAIIHPGTNIRKEPTTLSKIVTIAQKGSQFPIISTENDWYAIQLPSGQKAYVAGWIVSVSGIEDTVKHGIGQALSGKTLIVDAGHGGYDSGSIGSFFNTREKDVNLAVAKRLQTKLESAGAKVVMTREGDYKVSLEQRTALASSNQADAFISLHHNTISNPYVSGSITYYYKNQDQRLGNIVQDELLKQNRKKNLGTRFGNFFVLRENQKTSVLVELSFLTNYEDELQARSSQFQELSAEGIFQGIVKFFNK